MKTIEVTDEIYEGLIEFKKAFSELSGENIESESEIIGILITGFIESIEGNGENEDELECGNNCKCKKNN